MADEQFTAHHTLGFEGLEDGAVLGDDGGFDNKLGHGSGDGKLRLHHALLGLHGERHMVLCFPILPRE